jgi:hypothetical protein
MERFNDQQVGAVPGILGPITVTRLTKSQVVGPAAGCGTPQALRYWIRRDEADRGERAGRPTSEMAEENWALLQIEVPSLAPPAPPGTSIAGGLGEQRYKPSSDQVTGFWNATASCPPRSSTALTKAACSWPRRPASRCRPAAFPA